MTRAVPRARPRARRSLLALTAIALLAAPAVAEPVTVGVFAPSAPFDGTGARLAYANALAAHLFGADGVGRVYGRAGDFTAALARGEIQFAVADASYLASAGGGVTALAVAVRDGDTAVAWQLVARGGVARVLDLRGKTVVAPVADPAAFVDNAMLGGELGPGFFKVEASPDVLSAVAAVELGKADAAVVPTTVALPGAVTRVTTLPTVSWPVLVAARGAPADLVARARERAASFAGAGALGGFRAAGATAYQDLARRLGRKLRQAPMVVPALRLAVGALLADRTLTIARPPLTSYVTAAAPPP